MACRGFPLVLAFLLALPGAQAWAGEAGSQENPCTVFVSIPPHRYVVARVAGPRARVEALLPVGQSPATYEPSPRQMARLAGARLYFPTGLPFEAPLLRRMPGSFPDVEVVDLRQGVPLRVFQGQEGSGQGQPDPHVWLDPRRMKTQAGTACEALCRADPAGEPGYRSRLAGLVSDLEAADRRVSGILAPVRGGKIYVFHPAFGYFADAYGLVQVPLETEGKEPGPRQMAALMEQARTDRVRVLFVQPQHPTREAQAVADEVGARIEPLDPLAEDYPDNLDRMAASIREALGRNP